jgi:hypothetical protein
VRVTGLVPLVLAAAGTLGLGATSSTATAVPRSGQVLSGHHTSTRPATATPGVAVEPVADRRFGLPVAVAVVLLVGVGSANARVVRAGRRRA